MDNDGIQLFSFCKKKVGDGKSTLFWDDIWLGDSSLRVRLVSGQDWTGQARTGLNRTEQDRTAVQRLVRHN